MNTNSLKRFAKEARIKLLDQVGRKLEFVLTHDTAELRGKEAEITQLKNKIAEQGKDQVIETVAYTWFNRLMALRFMDANGYTIPKVVTPLPGMTNPEILQNALGGNIESALQIDRQRLNDLLDGKSAATDAYTEAYKMLLVASCNQWHTAMPFMFERISDYTELLIPDDLLSDYSIVADIRNGMSDEDCKHEELIGWLYQFYITDKKDDVFEGLKRNIKISADNIPAATQLFTPRWIVRYMVENTLGKLWLTLKPNSKLRQHMPYFIEEPVGNGPAPMPEGIKGVKDITFLDPCQGSGHILVYAFELFTKIYEEEGYNTNEIPALILAHNLFGIDIDERAAQLAAFALTMKSRSYYPRFLRKPVQPHVIALENASEETIRQSVKLPIAIGGKSINEYRDLSLQLLTQADNFGSLIQINSEEAKSIQIEEGSIWQEQQHKLKEQAEYLSRRYHCVVTNPPYMGSSGMNEELALFAKKYYCYTKSDLFAMFIERGLVFIHDNCYLSMITMQNWMFLGSFENLRNKIINEQTIISLIQIGYNSFPELNSKIAQACTFVLNRSTGRDLGSYINLNDATQASNKETIFHYKKSNDSIFRVNQKDFNKIPGSPLGYWLTPKTLDQLTKSTPLSSFGQATKGLDTCDNNRFVRFWFEVSYKKISRKSSLDHKWFVYQKGGDFQKWFGNDEKLVNWENDGFEIKNFRNDDGSIKSRPQNLSKYFQTGITWSSLGSSTTSYRFMTDSIFGGGGNGFFPDKKYLYHFLGFLNSKVSKYFKDLFNPTLNNLSGDLHKLPIGNFLEDVQIYKLVNECIELTKKYLGLRESNFLYNFSMVPATKDPSLLKTIIEKQSTSWKDDILKIQLNETSINRILIDSYGLQDEIDPNVPLQDITILQEEAKIVNDELFIDPVPVLLQFVSYSVGTMFGRYSVDKPGLILANQGETLQDFLKQVAYPSFMPDEDNIIPVLEGEWFKDDIVGRFKVFLKATFGEEHFEENLYYIQDTIGKDIRKYFVKDFYNDHIKRYKKRPIYWMFSSPKGHFKALIYMHRYQPDSCSKLLNDYLQIFIGKLEAKKQDEIRLSLREDISAREKLAAIKEIDKLELMLKDCQDYEKTLFAIATQKIAIDLDDGIKVNYQKFKDVLVPIKGLEKEED